MKKLINKKNFYIIIAIFVLGLFAYITYRTPPAGDDWGYAMNGYKNKPFWMAFRLYQTWSGRFFSELYGMVVPCRKWLWNIINPLLFFGIYICVYKLANVTKKYILIPLILLAMMLSIEQNLRMETYTWMMGTTYVIPLFLSLLYCLILSHMFEYDLYDNKFIVFAYLDNILLFIIGLMMENIAATMIVGIVVAIIYAYFNKRKAIKYLAINLFFAILSFVICRLSPGSAYRLESENSAWLAMNIWERISSAYSNWINITFVYNNYTISLFSIVLILLIMFNKKEISLTYKIISIIFSALGIIGTFYYVFNGRVISDVLFNVYAVFWPLYVINAFITILVGLDDSFRKTKAIYLLMMGGCSALVMLYSPIYGSRSAIYLVYYLIAVSCLVLEEINLKKKYLFGLFIIFVAIICDRTYEYVYKYTLVGETNAKRLELIDFYREHPEYEEVWIPRYPIYTIHGADVDSEDTYHLEQFKLYYDLPQDYNKIYFYWE